MKILKITESQYKRLIRKNLNEEIVYNNPEDEKDLTVNALHFLRMLSEILITTFQKDLNIDKVEDGIIYIDGSKYNDVEKGMIDLFINDWIIKYPNLKHSKPGELIYNIGVDFDYDDRNSCYCRNIKTNQDVTYFCNEGLPLECKSEEDPEKIDPEKIDYNIYDDLEGIEDYKIDSSGFAYDGLTTGEKVILYLISEKESVGHSYDSVNPGKIINGLSEMTLKDAKKATGGKAAGRYQFMGDNFESFSKMVGLNMDSKFSPENQDKMAVELFKDKMRDCLELEDVLVRTWAALPVLYGRKNYKGRQKNRGDSYYEEKDINSSLITPAHFERALKKCGCDMTNLSEKIKNDKPVRANGESCTPCMGNITNKQEYDYNKYVTDKTIKQFRRWLNNNKKEELKTEFSKCCRVSFTSDPSISSDSGEKNFWTLYAFSLYGNEWLYSTTVKVDDDDVKNKKTTYITKNGNIDKSDLTKIMNDTNGKEEYLSKEAALQFNKMVIDAKKEGIDIKITDAYRPCGEPGDYERYKKGARYTQWAAWEENNFNPNRAAAPYPSDKTEWLKQGGGKCTSHHGLGNAVDFYTDKKGSEYYKKLLNFLNTKGKNYGFYKIEAHGEAWHYNYCGQDAKNRSSKCPSKTNEEKVVKILVIGDSQSTVASWKAQPFHTYLSSNYSITNKAIGGKNTKVMLNELNKEFLGDGKTWKNKYDVVIIFGGGNDAYREIEDTSAQSNLTTMYNKVKNSNGDKPLLIAISNPTKKHRKGTYPSDDAIGSYVESSNVPDKIIPVHSSLQDKKYFNQESLPTDNIHLGPEGQKWIYNELQKILTNNGL